MTKEIFIRKAKESLGLGSRPDFFLIGAQKSGTTSLYEYLVKSSKSILPAMSKELNYFTERFLKGHKAYKANFPIFKRDKLTGEATPDYLFYHRCPEIVYSYNPNAKIIIILRDPVQRAFSQYTHQNYTWKTKASDPMTFSSAIREEESRFNVDPLSKFYYEYKYYSYKSRGLYYKQICNWLNFFDKSQVYVLFLSDLQSDPKEEVSKVIQFLGVEMNGNNLQFPVKNESPKSKINKADELYLRKYYRDDSMQLFELLGERPRWEI